MDQHKDVTKRPVYTEVKIREGHRDSELTTKTNKQFYGYALSTLLNPFSTAVPFWGTNHSNFK